MILSVKIKVNWLYIVGGFFFFIGCKNNETKKIVGENVSLEDSNSIKAQSKTIEQFENNTSYFIREIDINNDGIEDKVVSSEKYKGNQIYFFQKAGNNYELVLESINFSEDGGRIIADVLPSKDNKGGIRVHTYFPDGGNNQATYVINFQGGNWIFTKTIYEIGDWKDDHTKVYLCEVDQNLIFKNLISEEIAKQIVHLPEESKREHLCKVEYRFENSLEDFIKRFKGDNSNLYKGVNRYKALLTRFDLSNNNIREYNDIAYYLEKSKAYNEAVFLLEKITQKFPNRTVAYINLGDAYWGLEEREKAKKSYQIYIEQMKAKGKDSKIPKRVLERSK
ncbi:tetratricopeptide repeat protein [Aquimarina sp. BL5]|uniref:tetratricopeptide repeat protein n=1 Tax=Aquimarina sp. BL5 TaxID=1714860 RepID=UPI000EA8B176|nr:tetratricopeptide repeat protein [Aquimarina sp. BL5]RKM93361.1 tetratricopeptide repeat protein [Aquimarina sp. BL5]